MALAKHQGHPVFCPVDIDDHLRSRNIVLERVEVDPAPHVLDRYIANAIMLGYTEDLYVVAVRGIGRLGERQVTFSATGITEASETVAQWCVLNIQC